MPLTPDAIAANATCYQCIPSGMETSALIYLFGRITSMTDIPTIITGASCVQCKIPQGLQGSAMIYLLMQQAGITDINAVINGANCIQCKIPEGYQGSAFIYLANSILGN